VLTPNRVLKPWAPYNAEHHEEYAEDAEDAAAEDAALDEAEDEELALELEELERDGPAHRGQPPLPARLLVIHIKFSARAL
jgi:hypothetical protein